MDSYRPVVNRGATSMVEDRIAALEARASTLEARVRELEAPRTGALWDRARPEAPPQAPAAPPRASAPPPLAPTARPSFGPAAVRAPRDLEDFLGGRVLAWLGAVAVLAGLAFLLTIAISRGWVGEGARTALAGVLSAALLGAGVYLR